MSCNSLRVLKGDWVKFDSDRWNGKELYHIKNNWHISYWIEEISSVNLLIDFRSCNNIDKLYVCTYRASQRNYKYKGNPPPLPPNFKIKIYGGGEKKNCLKIYYIILYSYVLKKYLAKVYRAKKFKTAFMPEIPWMYVLYMPATVNMLKYGPRSKNK